MTKRRLLWVGDAVVSSGFARATHRILESLTPIYDVHVLGINYLGDPHTHPYKIYPCYPGGDYLGAGRLPGLMSAIGPAVVVIQQDPWQFPQYLASTGNAPVIGAVAVDGKMCQGDALNGLAHAIFWTKFGEAEAKAGGYTGPSTVIPLGVDHSIYKPYDRTEIREKMNIPAVLQDRGMPPDTFIVGVVGRNQARKRLDLTLQYFAEWVNRFKVKDTALWLHVAPTGDDAFDIDRIAKYYGIADRILRPDVSPIHGVKEENMARVYSVFDAFLNTSVGEGMGLPVLEAMACGIPCIVPKWSALEEWAGDAAIQIPCSSTAVAPAINTLGGVMDMEPCVQAFEVLYRNPTHRERYAFRAGQRASEPQFNWKNIGNAYAQVIEQTLYRPISMNTPIEVTV